MSTSCSENKFLKDYIPSEHKYQFSTEKLREVSMKKTFNIDDYQDDARLYIKPHSYFKNGMCLQRDAVNCIFGYAKDTDKVAVSINGNVYYGTVDNDGRFEVYLPMMNAGGPYNMEIITEMGRITIKSVYIGEVYLFAGQSNMEWQIWISGNTMKDLYEASDVDNDKIRLIRIPNAPSKTPTDEFASDAYWFTANKDTVMKFSAVAYIFGKKLQKELNCPVGLVSTAVGGSSIEHWLSKENYNKVKALYKPITDSNSPVMTPTIGYNGILHPLKGINYRGVVWYQGCSNTYGTEKYYDQALRIFIEQCKKDFNHDNLTFTICELARYQQDPYAYSIINERINELAKNDDKIAVARNLDLGNWYDIHPLDKRVIGSRAIDETLRLFYGKDIAEPVYLKSYKFNDDGTVTLELSKNVKLLNGTNGFEVSDGNKYTYDCKVEVNNNIVTVSANFAIKQLRYGYTCKMTTDIKNDVSKMVTIYDNNNMPLDLFYICN
jgi:sialate O-acetylesterase